MDLFDSICLGIIQGLTEFLPISSSGHLVLGQSVLGINQPGNEFEILVHMGTLASIIYVFFNDIKNIIFSLHTRETKRFILFIIIGTLPAVIIGISLKETIKSFFENLFVVGVSLTFTGLILFTSSYFKSFNNRFNYLNAFIIGLVQAIAIIPGISRSGMTISCALFLGINPKNAARFSFFLAIPVITGAGLLMALDINNDFHIEIPVAIGGFISSFFIGILSLKWLIGWLQNGKFHYFGVYCLLAGLLTIYLQ